MSNNWIFSILEDNRGFLWIGTENGLCTLDPLTGDFTTYAFDTVLETKLPSKSIRSIGLNQEGQVSWAGGSGLFRVNHQDKILETVSGNLHPELFFSRDMIITKIITEPSRLWLATTNGLILHKPGDQTWMKIPFTGKLKAIPGLEALSNIPTA